MGSLTDVAENALLNHLCSTAYTASATLFVALCLSDPTDTATTLVGVEIPNANLYARTSIPFANPAASRQVIQSGPVTFPQANGSWGAVSHWAIVTSGTYNTGTTLAHGAFTAGFTPVNGSTPTIPTSEIKVQFNASSGAGFSDYTVHKWLDLMFRNQAFAKPATYVGLSTGTALTDTVVAVSGLTEVSGTSYARVLVNITGGASPAWSTVAAGAVNNVQAINFPSPGAGGWTQITSMFLADSASGAGAVLAFDAANVLDQTAQAADSVQFAATQLSMSLT
jgi:hypothetical protein